MAASRPEIGQHDQRATGSYALPVGLLMFGFAVGFCLPLALLAWVALGVAGLSIPKHGLRLVVSSGALVLGLGLLGWARAHVLTA